MHKREFTKYLGPNRSKKMVVTTEYKSLGQEPYFSITAGTRDACGCLHDEIRKHFPELAYLIDWHLVSESQPMHYVANSIYWANQGNLEYARSIAIWPEAELSDFTKDKLLARLPTLMKRFHSVLNDHFRHNEIKGA